ncbi:MAG TPA: hypothetical protein VFI25_00710 [Planctomycetota bacterium]|nr:hypothetical protein [Planctomycetota bacterium]
MTGSGSSPVVLYSAGSPALEDLRRALAEEGVETVLLAERESVFAASPRAIVVDLQGFSDPWNDVRRFGSDERLASTGIFVYAENAADGLPYDRAGKIRRFARLVADSLGVSPRRA